MNCIAPGILRSDHAPLQALLERALSRAGNTVASAQIIRREKNQYSSSFTLEDLDVELGDGRRLELILKNLSWESLLEEARHARPKFLYDPAREILVYRHVLSRQELGTPLLVASELRRSAKRYWLVLERIRSEKLCHVGAFAVWERAARWLADFHAQFAALAPWLVRRANLLEYDRHFYLKWMHRAITLREQSGMAASLELAALHRLAAKYDTVVDRLLSLEPTVIHGEFYASNILVSGIGNGTHTRGALRICPVDWELAGCGPGLVDLAALVAGNWTRDQRLALQRAYFEQMQPSRPKGQPLRWSAFCRDVDFCRLHLAIQWTGWARTWLPPADQAQNWLDQALDLAAELGVG